LLLLKFVIIFDNVYNNYYNIKYPFGNYIIYGKSKFCVLTRLYLYRRV